MSPDPAVERAGPAEAATDAARIAVVGIGAEGWPGLGEAARAAISHADLLVGGERHLALVPDTGAERRAWPSPMEPLVDELASMSSGDVCVLASGDPMLHGIGATLARRVGRERLEVIPHPSAHALACGRLGWPAQEVELVSLVARPPEALAAWLQPGRRLVVYASGADGAARVARLVTERGCGPSRLFVFEELGGERERVIESTAADWGERAVASLHAVALECRAGEGTMALSRAPGLPDAAFEPADQLTKREVRAVSLAALSPLPGQLLWDVGAGSGSVAIEWMRADRSCRAIAVEARPERAEQIRRNALRLGVPELDVVEGEAPGALRGQDSPDAIFVGGGLTEPGLLDACLQALAAGGRLVANAVTLEGERVLHAACETHGGTLLRFEVDRAEPLGSLTGWERRRAVVQWSYSHAGTEAPAGAGTEAAGGAGGEQPRRGGRAGGDAP